MVYVLIAVLTQTIKNLYLTIGHEGLGSTGSSAQGDGHAVI